MATFNNRFPKVRLLLAVVSAISLTLGAMPGVYGQDVPTPTPPADGGEFEGAPDPTPGPDVTPEPTDVVSEEDEPTAGDLPDEPNVAGPDNTPDTAAEETTDAPTSEELTDDSADEAPVDEIAEDDDTNGTPAVEDPDVEVSEDSENEGDAAGSGGSAAPANNSPRGLW